MKQVEDKHWGTRQLLPCGLQDVIRRYNCNWGKSVDANKLHLDKTMSSTTYNTEINGRWRAWTWPCCERTCYGS